MYVGTADILTGVLISTDVLIDHVMGPPVSPIKILGPLASITNRKTVEQRSLVR